MRIYPARKRSAVQKPLALIPSREMKRAAAIILAMLLPVRAAAADDPVYEGTVGTAHIILTLSGSGNDVSGRYFYRTPRLDIDLSGGWHGNALGLESNTTGDHLALFRAGPNLTGTLTTAKSRRLPVNLHPAGAPSPLPTDLPGKLSLYERWHLASLSFTPQQEETINGKTIRWYREGLSGIRLFRLENGYSAPAMTAINHALARNQWSYVSAWFGCTGMDGTPGTDTAEAEKPWLGQGHVSYVWNASWSCAGTAHPDFGTEGHSFDVRTGRELKLDEVLRFGSAAPPPEDSDAWYTYRGKTFAAGVVALLKRYHSAEMAPPKNGDDDECDYSDIDVWNFPGWALSAKGLWLGAYFARVKRACDGPDWAIIPWSALSLPSKTEP